jgi:hypothetical protein
MFVLRSHPEQRLSKKEAPIAANFCSSRSVQSQFSQARGAEPLGALFLKRTRSAPRVKLA